jgi:hypothetical protein
VDQSYHPDLDRDRFDVMIADAVSSRATAAVHLEEQAPRGVLVSKRDPSIYDTADTVESEAFTEQVTAFLHGGNFSAIFLGCMRRSWRGGWHDPRTFDVA